MLGKTFFDLVRGGGIILFVSYILIISFIIDNFLKEHNERKEITCFRQNFFIHF